MLIRAYMRVMSKDDAIRAHWALARSMDFIVKDNAHDHREQLECHDKLSTCLSG
jgi:hypothetical protein